jgi:hypothetical protein
LVALLAACFAALAVSSASASPPQYVYRDVALVTVFGHGSVRSLPHGIACPQRCRALFVRGTHLRLYARAAAGWRFVGFSSKWCSGGRLRPSCAFDLVSPHDCVGGACPIGAFGVRARVVRET